MFIDSRTDRSCLSGAASGADPGDGYRRRACKLYGVRRARQCVAH